MKREIANTSPPHHSYQRKHTEVKKYYFTSQPIFRGAKTTSSVQNKLARSGLVEISTKAVGQHLPVIKYSFWRRLLNSRNTLILQLWLWSDSHSENTENKNLQNFTKSSFMTRYSPLPIEIHTIQDDADHDSHKFQLLQFGYIFVLQLEFVEYNMSYYGRDNGNLLQFTSIVDFSCLLLGEKGQFSCLIYNCSRRDAFSKKALHKHFCKNPKDFTIMWKWKGGASWEGLYFWQYPDRREKQKISKMCDQRYYV